MPEYDDGPGGVLRLLRNAETLLVATILAIILWVGSTTYQNSITLTRLVTQVDLLVNTQQQQIESLTGNINRIDGHLNTLWPRLREMKERIQHLESISKDKRSSEPWKY